MLSICWNFVDIKHSSPLCFDVFWDFLFCFYFYVVSRMLINSVHWTNEHNVCCRTFDCLPSRHAYHKYVCFISAIKFLFPSRLDLPRSDLSATFHHKRANTKSKAPQILVLMNLILIENEKATASTFGKINKWNLHLCTNEWLNRWMNSWWVKHKKSTKLLVCLCTQRRSKVGQRRILLYSPILEFRPSMVQYMYVYMLTPVSAPSA